MNKLSSRLLENLNRIYEDIARAATDAGRAPEDVQLVAISKYATAVETTALVEALHELGRGAVLGESRVQSLTQKAAELQGVGIPIQWDLVGSLQRNKAAQAAQVFTRIHSLDREAILRHLDEFGARQERTIRGFLQVNISDEGSKHGFGPEELPAALELADSLPHVRVEGLMGMAPRRTDHDTARPAFAQLRELRDRHAPKLPDLSMGMSGDYRGAILEGATVVRVGSALFAS